MYIYNGFKSEINKIKVKGVLQCAESSLDHVRSVVGS